MPAVLARISRIEMDAAVRATAGAYVTDALRSLDAVHLATAEVLVAAGKTVSAFVTYDARQAGAVEPTGIRVEIARPGLGSIAWSTHAWAPPVCRSRGSASG